MAQLSSCPHIFAPNTVNNHDAGIPCIHRFIEASVTAAEEYHAEVFDFLFKWIAEAPWLDHTIDSKVAVPVVRTRNEKNNANILLAYLAEMALYKLHYPDDQPYHLKKSVRF